MRGFNNSRLQPAVRASLYSFRLFTHREGRPIVRKFYSVAAAVLFMTGCTAGAQPVGDASAGNTLATAPGTSADFNTCLANLQERAGRENLSPRAVATVATMQQQQRVLELDGAQPEFVQTFGQYLNARLSEDRIRRGRELYARHRAFLDQLTQRYGVSGQYLVAFWG